MSKRLGKDFTFDQLASWDTHLITQMVRRGATRRDMLKWLSAAGLSASSAGVIFASASSAIASTPKRGGRLTFAMNAHGPDDSMDPTQGKTSADYFRHRMMYGSLTRLTDNLGYEPELAEEVIANASATEWTFKLRSGVEFHDGKTMDADDVIFSMNRHIGPDSSSRARQLVSMIDRWEKVNDHEVKAVLSSPNSDLPIALGTSHFKIVKNSTTDFSDGIGTGPYRLKEFSPGIRTIGVPFGNYWEPGGYLDELEVFGLLNPETRLNAFLNGEVDAIAALDPKSVPQLQEAGKDTWETQSSQTVHIACRTDMQPSGNIDLHRAFQYLTDRERMVKGVFRGHAVTAHDHPIGPHYYDHCAEIEKRTQDLDKAKWHLDRADIGSGPIEVVAMDGFPGAMEQCLFLQRDAEKIGLKIDVRKAPNEGYWSEVWKVAPISISGFNMRPTANMMLTGAYSANGSKETHWDNEKFNKMVVDVRAVTDDALRKEMYCELQTLVHNEAGYIGSVHPSYMCGVIPEVQGRTQVPTSYFGGSECPRTLWRSDA